MAATTESVKADAAEAPLLNQKNLWAEEFPLGINHLCKTTSVFSIA